MKRKLILLVLINLGLLLAFIFLLHQIGVIEIGFLRAQNTPPAQAISEDPFLIEREALKKQWAVLTAKESDLEQRQAEFDKSSQILQEKQKEINKQLETIQNAEKEKQNVATANAQDEASIRSLAQKIANIAPESGAAILNDMEPVIAVETIQMMDRIATEQGSASTTAYLISLMEPTKRKEVVRLLSAYPTTLGDLNKVPVIEDNPNGNSTTDTTNTP